MRFYEPHTHRTPKGCLAVFLGTCWKRLDDGRTAQTLTELDYGA